MSLLKLAQELLVEDLNSPSVELEVCEPLSENLGPSKEKCLEVVEHEHSEPLEVIFEFSGDLPGAPVSPEPKIEVHEENVPEVKENNDVKDSSEKPKKNEKWDWESRGPHGFVIWVKERFDTVPKHSGQDSSGVERALSYLEKLDLEISKAMRSDVDGELDANKIEEIRSKIDDGVDALKERLNKIKKSKKGNKKKSDMHYDLVKEGQKITGVHGVFVNVPLLISGIARVCINGVVSAGHDLKDMFERLSDKYKLNDRERTEVRWLLYDMGYPIRGDRGYMPDEEYDPTSSDNFDYSANYYS
jgi:hypothetical protein